MSQQINLYDPRLEKKRDWLALGNVAAASAVLLAVVVVAGVAARQDLPTLSAQAEAGDTQLKALREQVTALGQSIAAQKPDPALAAELDRTRELAAVRNEIRTVLQQRLGPEAVSYAEYLRGFARQTVAGLWLTGFSYDTASDGMEIVGRTVDPALLPQYIKRLNSEPVFQGRAFSALSLAEAQAAVPAGTAAPALRKPPYHDFKLVPRKGAAEADGKSAMLSQTPPAGRPG